MKNYLIFILLFLNISCQMANNNKSCQEKDNKEYCQIESNEYVKYQTFDEYKLMGVVCSDIKEPYVLAKKELDTIFVIRSNDSEKIIKYISKGAYWYSKSIIYVDTIPLAKQILWPTIYEKFIFDNTVIEYRYLLNDNLEKIDQYIYVHTKKDCIILAIQDNDIKNDAVHYNEIKEFVMNYKKIFPLYSPGYQPRSRRIYEKHIEGNILSIYRIDKKNKKIVLSKEMNSLGEFDNKGTMMWW